MFFKSFYRILLVIFVAIVVLFLVSYYRVLSILKEDQLVRLPTFVGMDIIEANEVLESINENLNKRINIRIIPVVQQNYPRYTVVKQDPNPRGIPVKEGRTINLQISMGSLSPLQVPNYIGKPISLIKEDLVSNKDSDNVEKPKFGHIILKPDSNIPKGSIISQDPLPGAIVVEDTKIDFIVSSGPYSNVVVGDYSGNFAEPIIKYLADKKILVSIDNKDTTDPEEDGKIVYQDIEKGSVLKEGDAIHFSVANYFHKDIDTVREYSIIRFVVPSMLDPFFKNKRNNIVEVSIIVKDGLGETIIYKGKKRFGEQIVECYKKNKSGSIEITLDDRHFKNLPF